MKYEIQMKKERIKEKEISTNMIAVEKKLSRFLIRGRFKIYLKNISQKNIPKKSKKIRSLVHIF